MLCSPPRNSGKSRFTWIHYLKMKDCWWPLLGGESIPNYSDMFVCKLSEFSLPLCFIRLGRSVGIYSFF